MRQNLAIKIGSHHGIQAPTCDVLQPHVQVAIDWSIREHRR